MTHEQDSTYVSAPIGQLLLRTALPIILVLTMNGLNNMVDAWILGIFIGPEALSAVTLMFPLYMLLVAFSTMVSTGMASIMARRLGAKNIGGATTLFAHAHLLSVLVAAIFIASFALVGYNIVTAMVGQAQELTDMAYRYIAILMYGSPILFLVTTQVDTLRCEGMLAFMAVITIGAALLNIVLDYIFIVPLALGVDGSAYATLLAQGIGLVIVTVHRFRTPKLIASLQVDLSTLKADIKETLALGGPTSLTYIGVSLLAIASIYGLQIWGEGHYSSTVGGYGIAMRLTSFSFLPLLGLSIAYQTLVGSNFGAKAYERVNIITKTAIITSALYCLVVQIVFIFFAGPIAGVFVDDLALVSETARILPILVLMFVAYGPLLLTANFFQAIGDAKKSGLLNIARVYIFGLPLVFIMPLYMGENGIWYSRVATEIGVIGLTLYTLKRNAHRNQMRYGLFYKI